MMKISNDMNRLTEGTTVAPDGLVAGIVVDDNVGLADGSGSHKVNGVATKVRVGEQLVTVPCRLVL